MLLAEVRPQCLCLAPHTGHYNTPRAAHVVSQHSWKTRSERWQHQQEEVKTPPLLDMEDICVVIGRLQLPECEQKRSENDEVTFETSHWCSGSAHIPCWPSSQWRHCGDTSLFAAPPMSAVGRNRVVLISPLRVSLDCGKNLTKSRTEPSSLAERANNCTTMLLSDTLQPVPQVRQQFCICECLITLFLPW